MIFTAFVLSRAIVETGIIQSFGAALCLLQDRGILINIAQLELKLTTLPDAEQITGTAQSHVLR